MISTLHNVKLFLCFFVSLSLLHLSLSLLSIFCEVCLHSVIVLIEFDLNGTMNCDCMTHAHSIYMLCE